jgi:subtilisin
MTRNRTRLFLTGIVFCLLAVLHSGTPLAQTQVPDGVIAGQWIVTLERNVAPDVEAFRLAQAQGGQVGHVYTAVLNGFSFHGSDAAAAALARNPLVLNVVPNRAVHAFAQTLPAGVRRIDASHPSAPDAHDQGFTGSGIRIAILDTGIDLDHGDLGSKIEASLEKNCMGVGRPDDGHGHGTHVAGTAAAVDNTIGVIGVASHATLVPVKVLDDTGSGSWETVICGINHVTANADFIKVANMSLGDSGSVTGCGDGGLHQAICESVAAGVVYTVAAGNSKINASNFIPAAYPEVITVSASSDYDGEPGGAGGCLFIFGLGQQCDDTFAKFSNFGSIVDVIAPGVQVYSADKNNTYSNKSGTSMAAPHVAGVVALVRAANPSLTPSQIEDLLKATGECPNAAQNVGGGNCSGQGTWTNDPDGIPEPLVNALWAAEAAGGGGSNNSPPAAGNVSVGGNEDTVIGWLPVVSDPDVEDTLSCSILTNPSHGSAAVNPNCSAGTYTPNPNYNGPDSFTYRVSDGSATADGTVTLTVQPVNDPPVANDDSYSIATGGTLNVAVPGVLGNDTDVDGPSLIAVLVAGPTNGDAFTLNADGSFTYTHNGGPSTSDSFTYATNDGTANSNVATVHITIGSATTMHVGDIDGSKSSQGGSWTATVAITVHDSGHNPLAGAAVSGTWSNGATGSASCTTDTNGRCSVLKSGIPKRTSSVRFTVGNVTLSSLNYDSTGNHDPDSDSNGIFITVTKP